jgi:lysozyme
MMDRAFGIDVSKWNGEMDWRKAKLAGCSFVFIRAGSIDNVTGQCYTDTQFRRNADQAPAHLPAVGYYWYYRPNHDPVKQAIYYVDLLRTAKWNLPPVIDVETAGGVSCSVLASRLAQMVNCLASDLGVKPIIYTRASFWNVSVNAHPLWPNLDLWIARYKALDGPWSDGLYKPRDWDAWRFWQCSADNNRRGVEFGAPRPPAADADMDINFFNGDVPALYAYAGITSQPEPTDAEKLDRLWQYAQAQGWKV